MNLEQKTMRLSQLVKRFGVSRSTGYRRLRPFLKQYKIGKVTVYPVAEADALVQGSGQ
jgi:hypothetical protein